LAVEEENRRRNTLASTCPNTSANQKNYSHAHSRGGRDSNVDIANATIYPTDEDPSIINYWEKQGPHNLHAPPSCKQDGGEVQDKGVEIEMTNLHSEVECRAEMWSLGETEQGLTIKGHSCSC